MTGMLVKFLNSAGEVQFRTVTYTNLRRIAESIQIAHPGHPLSHTIGVLQNRLRAGHQTTTLTCDCGVKE